MARRAIGLGQDKQKKEGLKAHRAFRLGSRPSLISRRLISPLQLTPVKRAPIGPDYPKGLQGP